MKMQQNTFTAQVRVTHRLQLTDLQTRELRLSSTLETLVCKKQIQIHSPVK